jgi:hypothetical protein
MLCLEHGKTPFSKQARVSLRISPFRKKCSISLFLFAFFLLSFSFVLFSPYLGLRSKRDGPLSAGEGDRFHQVKGGIDSETEMMPNRCWLRISLL